MYSHHKADSDEDGNRLSGLAGASLENNLVFSAFPSFWTCPASQPPHWLTPLFATKVASWCFIVYFKDQFFKVFLLSKNFCWVNFYLHNNNKAIVYYTRTLYRWFSISCRFRSLSLLVWLRNCKLPYPTFRKTLVVIFLTRPQRRILYD